VTSDGRQLRSRRASAVRAMLAIGALLFLSVHAGCSFLPPDKLPYQKLSLPYERTRLGATTALDVLNFARDPAYQFQSSEAEPVLVTQSETGVAYSGRSKDGRKTWLDLIVFEDARMTAGRKYFFCVDEQATTDPDNADHHFFLPRKGILFDSQFAIDPAVLTAPYATEEAQKTAILKWLAARFQNDVTALVGSLRTPTQGNRQVIISGLMVNQVFQGLFTELAQSPGLAKNLSTDRGVQFPHASLGTGRIRLLVANDIGTLTIRVNLPLAPRQKP
jgi:hypothetical protein